MPADEKDITPNITAGDSSGSSTQGKGHVLGEDVAAKYANVFTNGDTWSPKEWWRLRWKLDARLVPLLWFNVTLGAMDKVTTSTAALYGFIEDTSLYGDRYSWVGSAFYVSVGPGLW